MAHVNNMTGNPRFTHTADVIGSRVFSESDATMMFAVAPMMVPLPPKPAPSTNAHYSGPTSMPVSPKPLTMGINAMVIGTLSTTADSAATIQMMSTPNRTGEMPEDLLKSPTTRLSAPECSSHPTMMKSAPKKTSTLHSTFLRIS